MIDVRAITFDTYGTLVDWRSSVLAELTAFGATHGPSVDWIAFLDEWKACYRPGMDEVNAGRRPWTTVDVLYHQRLEALLADRGLTSLDPGAVAHRASAAGRRRRRGSPSRR
jgi:2-haloacid dehalogenase